MQESGIMSEFNNGRKLVRIDGSFKKEKIKINFPIEHTALINENIHLLSVTQHLNRQLLYTYVSECIELFQEVKKEGLINSELANVMESLLHAMDYLTNQVFIDATFTVEHSEELQQILGQSFESTKEYRFSNDSNRPLLLKSKLYEDEGSLYAIDSREEGSRHRVYMAVIFKKSESKMENFKQVAGLFQDVQLKPSSDGISYEEMMKGITSHQLHTDTLFHINRVKNTLTWVLNSYSWRMNEFAVFDEIDICSKLGIRY